MVEKTLGRLPLGDLLVEIGVLTPEQLAAALAECQDDQRALPGTLVGKGIVTEDAMLRALSMRQRIPYFASLDGLIDPDAARLVPEKTAREFLVAPVKRLPRGLLLAMLNSQDLTALDSVAAVAGMPVLPMLTTRATLFATIARLYAPAEVNGGARAAPAAPVPAPAPADSGGPDDDVSVIETVDALIDKAIDDGASDIHLEPTERLVRVRYRVDGLLQDRDTFPKEFHPALVARIKILARLDITESRLPQDGHIRHAHKGRGVDLRVSSLPSLFGEKIVVRILDHSKGIRRLDELGMGAANETSFRAVLQRPTGLLLVTGPTGSGKTTTLYAALNSINTHEKNIVTLEDPIEYHLEGITQTETNPRIGLTFAAGLRAILRQDPNVILVGEIRDLETAEIAVQAAMTGHLVLSTLHTKDTIGTVARLLNMKIQPFLLSAALSGVLAQRLVRTLCLRCKRAAVPKTEDVARLGVALDPRRTIYEAAGCRDCFDTGYAGRLAIYEWLEITEEVRASIISGSPADELRRSLKAKGARTLQDDGLAKIYQGVTSLAEVIRVTHEEKL